MANPKQKMTVMRTAKKTVDRFMESWEFAKGNHHARWTRNWKLFNNQRTDVGYQGITNTFVPMTFSTVETLTAALTAGRPSIDFVPQDMYKYIASYYDNGSKPDLRALNAQFDYYWDCDNWDLKTMKTVRGGFVYGTSCEWIYWDVDKPRVINLNVRDAIIDPSLTDPMQLWTDPGSYYTGRRYMTTLKALKAEKTIDPKTGDAKPRYKNLDSVRPGMEPGEGTDKMFKDMDLGSLGASKDEVEVIEVWDGERIISVANRQATIESRPNELGCHCLVIHRFIADESQIYGKAIVDVIAKTQELLNDVSNQRVDVVTDVMNPQYELDPMYVDWIDKIKNAPSTVYPFKPNSLQVIQKPQMPTGAFQETANLQNIIREATAADQVVRGLGADRETTATEINAQLQQAGERFTLYVRMLEREALWQRAKIVYTMMLHHLTERQLVPVNSPDGPKFRKFEPAQFDDSYEPSIQLDANVKANKTQEAVTATRAFGIIIKDPTNDLWEAKKQLYPKMFDLSEEQLDKIIGSQKPEMAPVSGADQMGAGGPAEPSADAPADPTMQAAQPEMGQEAAA